MKNNSFIYRLIMSLCYLTGAGCFFFRYIAFGFSDNGLFGKFNSEILLGSSITDAIEKLDSYSSILKTFDAISDIIGAIKNFDVKGLVLELIFFFVVPIILAFISAIIVLIEKRKSSAGLTAGVLGLICAAINILLRITLQNTGLHITQDNFIPFSLFIHKTISTDISLIMFVVAAIGSFVLVFLFKNSEKAEEKITAGNNYANNNAGYNQGLAENNQNNAYEQDKACGQNYVNNNPVNVETAPFSSLQDDDEVTYRVPENLLPNYINNKQENQNYRNENVCSTIICKEGMYKGISFPIKLFDEVIIGRDSSQAHIVLDAKYKYVSKKHCGILYENNGRYRVKVYSSNGIFVNGKERIGQGEELMLTSGTAISVGNKENTFLLK